jgi:hypothetical protein
MVQIQGKRNLRDLTEVCSYPKLAYTAYINGTYAAGRTSERKPCVIPDASEVRTWPLGGQLLA